jgi:hypothetical protein
MDNPLIPIASNSPQSELAMELANYLKLNGVLDMMCLPMAMSIMSGIHVFQISGDPNIAKQEWI